MFSIHDILFFYVSSYDASSLVPQTDNGGENKQGKKAYRCFEFDQGIIMGKLNSQDK